MQEPKIGELFTVIAITYGYYSMVMIFQTFQKINENHHTLSHWRQISLIFSMLQNYLGSPIKSLDPIFSLKHFHMFWSDFKGGSKVCGGGGSYSEKSVSVTVKITVYVVTYPSHDLCWKLIHEVGNYWEYAHGMIVMNGFTIATVHNFHWKTALCMSAKWIQMKIHLILFCTQEDAGYWHCQNL